MYCNSDAGEVVEKDGERDFFPGSQLERDLVVLPKISRVPPKFAKCKSKNSRRAFRVHSFLKGGGIVEQPENTFVTPKCSKPNVNPIVPPKENGVMTSLRFTRDRLPSVRMKQPVESTVPSRNENLMNPKLSLPVENCVLLHPLYEEEVNCIKCSPVRHVRDVQCEQLKGNNADVETPSRRGKSPCRRRSGSPLECRTDLRHALRLVYESEPSQDISMLNDKDNKGVYMENTYRRGVIASSRMRRVESKFPMLPFRSFTSSKNCDLKRPSVTLTSRSSQHGSRPLANGHSLKILRHSVIRNSTRRDREGSSQPR